jgi:hypothetical protein
MDNFATEQAEADMRLEGINPEKEDNQDLLDTLARIHAARVSPLPVAESTALTRTSSQTPALEGDIISPGSPESFEHLNYVQVSGPALENTPPSFRQLVQEALEAAPEATKRITIRQTTKSHKSFLSESGG